MFSAQQTIAGFDPELANAMALERRRQEDHIELIASENYASPRVLEAQGSVLTNKYAEGYPGKRYYGGCEHVDVVESLAIERAKTAIRGRLRQCAAAQRLAGQRCGLSRAADTRRHDSRHESRAWWSPDAWREGVVLGQAVQRGAVRGRSTRPA